MKHRLNFYNDSYQPQIDWLSLPSISLVLSLLLCVVVLAAVVVQGMAGTAETQYVQTAMTTQQIEQSVSELEAQVMNRTHDPALLQEIENTKQRIADHTLLLHAIETQMPLKQKRFSLLLSDLADASQASLWLTHIVVSEASITFKGGVSTPEALPQWIQRLGGTESLSQQKFSSTTLLNEEGNMRFTLSTEPALPADNLELP
ncbi:PilN domain-containing protein [Aestuariibacter sp. A3R04]|uniref:PilN domain-containing protein n=1 Tax=Aestuariibacter sp. A3R04 TaxID=2841571 RepID=UPI001C09CB54|nr:PilN domain-containing protein [Aestuariibacter sp. A3R04]MBU3020628.1 hypothetical protein [Aestuariibacter sp. A3R04]